MGIPLNLKKLSTSRGEPPRASLDSPPLGGSNSAPRLSQTCHGHPGAGATVRRSPA